MLKDLVLKNRSYRGFDESRRVTREELAELVDLTRYTASSVNMQPLKYYLSWEKDQVEQLVARTRWAAALSQLHLPHPGTHPHRLYHHLPGSGHQSQSPDVPA